MTNGDTAGIYKQLLGYLIIHDLHISLGLFLEKVRHRDVYLVRYRPDIGKYIRFALEADFHDTIGILNKHLPGMTQACIEAYAEDAVMMDSVSRLKSVWQYLTKDQYFIRRIILRSASNNSTGALRLLEKNLSIGQTDLQYLLLAAIRNKSEALVRHWLDRGAKTRLQEQSEVPSWAAARCGNAAIMSMLLDTDDEPFHNSSVSDRLLGVALEARNLSVVDVLVYAGADELSVPLETAVTAGHANLVDKILIHQAKNKDWIPPAPLLQLACVNGHLEIARALINHGSKLDPRIPMALGGGNSPLMGAVSSNHPDIVEYLISRGASFDASGVFGNALQTAAYWNYHDVAVVLLQNNFDVDARAEPLPSALAIALRRGNLDIVTLLLQHRASTKDLESYDRLLCGYRVCS
ncbi:ankyrin repeat domain-containing protein [Aspergillus melleus]|uniref:ankyrin repeat domain-containing protein n=1 Tax=Aspergillus melleus TaxID=138277 RepID=UPI001E8CDB11|nr:uncharacterized protein LDX57_010575 [Aspergillus melleus]KAH8432942.1 hypothetical protein LDX57_010575 [Aspergillus melleus]